MHRRTALLVILAGLSGFQVAAAAEPDFAAFARRFGAAMEANDAAAVASLTRLPFLFENRALDRDQFLQAFPQLFDAEVRACLARVDARAEEPGLMVAFCRPYAFYFGLADGEWRLVEFAADGEPD